MDFTSNPVSVADNTETPAAPVSIAPVETTPPINPDTALANAAKAKWGLPSMEMSGEDMFSQVMAGREGELRKQASALVDFQTSLKKQQIVNEMAQKSPRPFTPIETKTIKQFLDTKETDPNAVFEQFFAKTYMENVRKAAADDPESTLNELRIQQPELFENTLNFGTDLKAKHEGFKKLQEDVDVNSGGKLKHIFDFLKYSIPLYNEYNLRGVTGDYQSLLGSNLDRVASDIYRMPYAEGQAKAKAIVEKLMSGSLGGNPGLAATFLMHLTDASLTQTSFENLFSVLDFGILSKVPKAGMMLKSRFFRAASKAAGEDIITQAVKDMVTAPDVARDYSPGNFSAALSARSLANEYRPALSGVRSSLVKEGIAGPEFATSVAESTSLSTNSFSNQLLGKIQYGITNEWAIRSKLLYDRIKPTLEFSGNTTMSVKSAMADMVRKVEASAQEAAGATKEAGITTASRQLTNHLTPGSPTASHSIEGLPSAFNDALVGIRQDTRGVSQELVNRIYDGILSTKNKLLETIANTAKVERIPTILASRRAVSDYVNHLRSEHSGLNNSLMDVKIRYDRAQNIHLEDWHFGRNGYTLFSTEKQARAFVTKSQLATREDGFGIRPKGSGFEVVITKPLDETHPIIRGYLTTGATRTPDSWVNAWGGYVGSLRTSEETLAAEQHLNRKIAAYGPGQLLKMAKETGAEIKKLRGWTLPGSARRAKWQQWQGVVSELAKVKDPVTGEYNGGFRTIGDLRDFYQNKLHRLPDEQEIAAAFAFKNQQLILKELENSRIRTEKLRVGAQTHEISVPNTALGTARSSPYAKLSIDGTAIREFPHDGETVLVVGKELGEERLLNTNQFKSKAMKAIVAKVESGELKMIRVTNQEERGLGQKFNIGTSSPKYVIAERVTSRELKWNQIDRSLYPVADYDHYVAQPIIRHDPVSGFYHYVGDKYIAGFNIRAFSQDVARDLNNIRRLLQTGDEASARAMHGMSKLPQSFSEIKSWFTAEVTTEGLPIPARLSLEHDIKAVPFNTNIHEMDKTFNTKYGDKFRDQTGERFRQKDRDPEHLWTLNNEGSRANPLYSVGETQFVDPITTMNRALNRAIQETYLNDYKLFSVEHWISEAKEWLDVSDNALASAPTYFFHNPKWKEGAPVDRINNLMTAQQQIRQFLGIQDKTTTYLQAAAQSLADGIFSASGESLALVPLWAIPRIKDKITFMRSLTFDAKLGLFALPQLWVQAQTFTNIMGIAGFQKAAPGVKAMLLHQWSRYSKDPGILDHMDTMAQGQIIPGTERFRPGWWKEAHDTLVNTGFETVGLEHARLDNPFGHNIIGHMGSDFLNAGRVFFTESERATRIGAWYTAYLEHRVANPTGALSNTDVRNILNRADLLTSNMSRASNSALNQGILSIPTQFLTYTLRTAELFLGKRLTTVERARLFGFNAAMYGLPVAFGLSGAPLGENLKGWAQENGYVAGSNYVSTAIAEGLPSMLMGLVSGQHYNVGERFGPQGFEDLLRSDEPWWKLMGGATGSTLGNAIGSLDGFTNAMLSAFRDDDKKYKLTPEDIIRPFQEIYSVNAAVRLIAALNTGKLINKREEYITDVTPVNAIFQFFSGLSPEEQAVMYRQQLTRKNEKHAEDIALRSFIEEFRRGLTAMETNTSQGNAYIGNAYAILRIGGYPEDKIPSAVALAVDGYESLVSRTSRDYFTKGVSEPRKEDALEAYRKTLQNRGN